MRELRVWASDRGVHCHAWSKFAIGEPSLGVIIDAVRSFLPFDAYLAESRLAALGEVIVEVEYLDVDTVNRPYSLDVGIFKGIVEPYL